MEVIAQITAVAVVDVVEGVLVAAKEIVILDAVLLARDVQLTVNKIALQDVMDALPNVKTVVLKLVLTLV